MTRQYQPKVVARCRAQTKCTSLRGYLPLPLLPRMYVFSPLLNQDEADMPDDQSLLAGLQAIPAWQT